MQSYLPIHLHSKSVKRVRSIPAVYCKPPHMVSLVLCIVYSTHLHFNKKNVCSFLVFSAVRGCSRGNVTRETFAVFMEPEWVFQTFFSLVVERNDIPNLFNFKVPHKYEPPKGQNCWRYAMCGSWKVVTCKCPNIEITLEARNELWRVQCRHIRCISLMLPLFMDVVALKNRLYLHEFLIGEI